VLNGAFTGHKLPSYTIGANVGHVEARRIMNSTDRAELIANYARNLKQCCWSVYEDIRIFLDDGFSICGECGDCLQPDQD